MLHGLVPAISTDISRRRMPVQQGETSPLFRGYVPEYSETIPETRPEYRELVFSSMHSSSETDPSPDLALETNKPHLSYSF